MNIQQLHPIRSPGCRGQTGPRTVEGKARSSRNAVKHGLNAGTAVLPGEDVAEHASFVAEAVASLRPNGKAAEAIARQIDDTLWESRLAADWREVLSRMLTRNHEELHRNRIQEIEQSIYSIREQIARLQQDPELSAPLLARLSRRPGSERVGGDDVGEMHLELLERFNLGAESNSFEQAARALALPDAAVQDPWRWPGWTIDLARSVATTVIVAAGRNVQAVLAEEASKWEAELPDRRYDAQRNRKELRAQKRSLELERGDLCAERLLQDEPRLDLLQRYDTANVRKLERLLKVFQITQKMGVQV